MSKWLNGFKLLVYHCSFGAAHFSEIFLKNVLTLPMLRLLLFKAQGSKEPSKHCHVVIHWIALTEHSRMIEYPCARVSVIFTVFCIILYWLWRKTFSQNFSKFILDIKISVFVKDHMQTLSA